MPMTTTAAALYIANNGKPTDAVGAESVGAAVIAAGVDQAALCVDPLGGFGGDVDVYPEGLLNTSGL
jgi:hypothetical protein